VLRDRLGDPPYAGQIAAIMAGRWRGQPRSTIRSSGYVADSLEAAIWCVARTGAFAEAVLHAANLGDDADTVAAIAGQLAGALYGYRAIPNSWLGTLTSQGMNFGMARQLIDATAAGKAASTAPEC
jgi:ADP-ribosyl-[dinitrogen reductase] hydrolase